jgi:hypothetical protein
VLNGKEKDPAAVQFGRWGAKARMKELTAQQRSAIAREAIAPPWAKKKE